MGVWRGGISKEFAIIRAQTQIGKTFFLLRSFFSFFFFFLGVLLHMVLSSIFFFLQKRSIIELFVKSHD